MEQAINAYYKITASPEFRELERMRERARNDEMSALHHAEMKGAFESMITSIQNLANNLGWSADQAMAALNIPEEERPKYREHLPKQP